MTEEMKGGCEIWALCEDKVGGRRTARTVSRSRFSRPLSDDLQMKTPGYLVSLDDPIDGQHLDSQQKSTLWHGREAAGGWTHEPSA